MKTQLTREELLTLIVDLEITDDEAGERDWSQYLNDRQLADAINSLRPDQHCEAD